MKNHKWLSGLIVVLVVIISAIGVFSSGFEFEKIVVNAYGDEVELFGRGIYTYESLFKAPILIGTDFIFLVFIVPSFIYFQWFSKKKSIKNDIVLLGYMTCFMYYSASLAFGAIYNALFMLYISLFSLVFFRLWNLLKLFDFQKIEKTISNKNVPKGVRLFLVLAGASVMVWLVEIIGTIFTGRPPTHIGMNTTEPTFVKDLGLILPLCWLSSYWIGKKQAVGVVIGSMMLILCGAIGLIVISQSVFQYKYNVIISAMEVVLYVVPFVALSLLSFSFLMKLLKWAAKN